MVRNASTISPSLSETNTRILAIETSIKSISSICSDINDKLSIVIQNSTMNSSAIDSLDCRVNQLDKDLKTYVDSQFKGVYERIEKIPPPGTANQPPHTQASSIEMLKREVKSIKSKQKRDELTISYISDAIADVKDQLDQSLDKSVGSDIDNSHELTPPLPEITPVQSEVSPREMLRNNPSNSRTNERDLIKDSVESTAKLIRQLINTKISEHTDFNLIKKCNNDVKKVTAYVKSSQDALMKYISYDNYDQDYVDSIKELLNRTNEWILQTELVYSLSEAHSINSNKGDISSVGVFTNNAEKTIYEFFEEVEIGLLGWGTSKQRAAQLYNNHLSEDIKAKTLECSDNYNELKKWLIKEHGDPDTIVDDILSALTKRSKNNITSNRDRHTFLADVSRTVARLDKLIRIPEIELEVIESILYSRHTLKDLFSALPQQDILKLNRRLTQHRLDWKHPKGAATFALFKEYCEVERDLSEPFRDTEVKTKVKSAFVVENQVESNVSSFTTTYSPPAPTQWAEPGLFFPCPLRDHKHEIAQCKTFLTMSPDERWEKIDKGKICYTCCKPKFICKGRKCNFIGSIPEVLVCQGCKGFAQYKQWSPFHVFLCRKPKHAETRAPINEIHLQCENYFGTLSKDVDQSNFKSAVNFMFQVYSVNPIIRSSLEKPQEIEPPSIHSQTGEQVQVPSIAIIPEIAEHAHYLMQILKIGSSEVLTFFDRGANVNLIDGELAISENLKRMSGKPSTLKVVGGGLVQTDYGHFSFNLGPTESDEFHELQCVGMSSVTNSFTKYDLSGISNEYRKALKPGEIAEKLPEYAAGTEVKLLIGIKNTYLDPTLIKILPSGVGVYKSPFKDIFGSRIIFAGPHSCFTSGNHELNNDVNLAVFKLRSIERDLLNPTIEIPIRIIIDKAENISVYPSPVSEQDLRELGGEILDDEFDEKEMEQRIMDHKTTGKDWYQCSVHSTRLPISKIRELVDQDDIDQLVTYRCDNCAKCEECKKSPRITAQSLQDAREQEMIEKSVRIDFKEEKVFVNFPFLKNPNEFLSSRHNSNSNYHQAKRIYLTQCKKNDIDKEGTRLTHKDLVDRGFMVKLEDLSTDSQKLINNAQFRHFYPWFIVSKSESISTPRRIVVDPSCTGLNLILPKGENHLGNIHDIIIRNRVKLFSWSSDISKLYNQLILEPSAYPFSLFLFHESLDREVEPDVYVMLRAWYGVIQTGGQAGFALDKLADIGANDYPLAKDCLKKDRYVDDILPGADTQEEAEEQILQVKNLLSKAGFLLKYVVKSGQVPEEKASTDGENIKILGYKWNTVADTIHPGIAEFNINKKIRGTQKPNKKPVINPEDAEEILKDAVLTRRIIISQTACLFDPLGLWEPIKLQLKLHSARLNNMHWDKKIDEAEQLFWKTKLPEFVRFGNLSARRCVIPAKHGASSGLRLICLSDAGKSAGGAVIYVGRKDEDGNWSCALMTSKSKMMHATVPRNELGAILIMAELAYVTRKSLEERVDEILYFTDSSIALAWMQNTNIKLRAYTFARVQASRRLIQMTTGLEQIPIYHIDGDKNIADLLTKFHDISIDDVSINSRWQNGDPWMRLDTDQMKLTKFSDLNPDHRDSKEVLKECFQDPFTPDENSNSYTVHHACSGVNSLQPPPTPPVDIIRLGWEGGIETLNIVYSFIQSCLHHLKKCHKLWVDCIFCKSIFDYRDNRSSSKNALYRYETERIKNEYGRKKLVKYFESNRILYFKGRLSDNNPFRFRDLDKIPFLDCKEFTGPLPVVRGTSPLLYALILDIHCNRTPHAGVELTIKEVFKEVMVIDGLRRLVKKIKQDCLKCRLLDRKTVELQISDHPEDRTTIAPPFYSMMIDIAFGFRGQTYRKSRSVLKFYALVCVCILTGATNILVLEGLQTQDVVGALERHASRHGVPRDVYVDNGTQLLSLKEASFSIRDIDTQVYHSMGIRVHESIAKSHEERGRVERKIRSLREMLEKLGVKTSNPMTSIQWETTFAKISSMIDDLPMARGDSSSTANLGYDILTANRLKLGRNNFRSLDGGGIYLENNQLPTDILERNRDIVHCWYQLFIDNIHMITLKPSKFLKNSPAPRVDDIVLFTMVDNQFAKESITWKLGRITRVESRHAWILYISRIPTVGEPVKSEIKRCFRDISIIYSVGDLFISTSEHYNTYCGDLFDQADKN